MIENSFLESGFGFTTSKVLPYIITLLIGLILVFILRARMNFKNRAVKIVVKLIIVLAPVAIYFAFYPIYEGDFSNTFKVAERTSEIDELSGDKLYVISIAGCPFCKDAMERMLLLEDRNPGMEVEYIVCNQDSTTLDFYTEINEGKIPIILATNPEALMILAEGTFPTFVLSKKNEVLKVWSNQNFGVRAQDEVEDLVKK